MDSQNLDNLLSSPVKNLDSNDNTHPPVSPQKNTSSTLLAFQAKFKKLKQEISQIASHDTNSNIAPLKQPSKFDNPKNDGSISKRAVNDQDANISNLPQQNLPQFTQPSIGKDLVTRSREGIPGTQQESNRSYSLGPGQVAYEGNAATLLTESDDSSTGKIDKLWNRFHQINRDRIKNMEMSRKKEKQIDRERERERSLSGTRGERLTLDEGGASAIRTKINNIDREQPSNNRIRKEIIQREKKEQKPPMTRFTLNKQQLAQMLKGQTDDNKHGSKNQAEQPELVLEGRKYDEGNVHSDPQPAFNQKIVGAQRMTLNPSQICKLFTKPSEKEAEPQSLLLPPLGSSSNSLPVIVNSAPNQRHTFSKQDLLNWAQSIQNSKPETQDSQVLPGFATNSIAAPAPKQVQKQPKPEQRISEQVPIFGDVPRKKHKNRIDPVSFKNLFVNNPQAQQTKQTIESPTLPPKMPPHVQQKSRELSEFESQLKHQILTRDYSGLKPPSRQDIDNEKKIFIQPMTKSLEQSLERLNLGANTRRLPQFRNDSRFQLDRTMQLDQIRQNIEQFVNYISDPINMEQMRQQQRKSQEELIQLQQNVERLKKEEKAKEQKLKALLQQNAQIEKLISIEQLNLERLSENLEQDAFNWEIMNRFFGYEALQFYVRGEGELAEQELRRKGENLEWWAQGSIQERIYVKIQKRMDRIKPDAKIFCSVISEDEKGILCAPEICRYLHLSFSELTPKVADEPLKVLTFIRNQYQFLVQLAEDLEYMQQMLALKYLHLDQKEINIEIFTETGTKNSVFFKIVMERYNWKNYFSAWTESNVEANIKIDNFIKKQMSTSWGLSLKELVDFLVFEVL